MLLADRHDAVNLVLRVSGNDQRIKLFDVPWALKSRSMKQPDLGSIVSDEAQAANSSQSDGHSAHLPGFLLDLAARCEEGQGEDGTVGGTACDGFQLALGCVLQAISNSAVMFSGFAFLEAAGSMSFAMTRGSAACAALMARVLDSL